MRATLLLPKPALAALSQGFPSFQVQSPLPFLTSTLGLGWGLAQGISGRSRRFNTHLSNPCYGPGIT